MTVFVWVTLLLAQGDAIKPTYATGKLERDKVFYEMKLGLKIEGPEQLVGFVRSMHPFLSMERLIVRTEGTRQVLGGRRQKIDSDESRVEMRYDDEDHEYDYTKGQPPEGDKDKLKQLMWFLAAGGKGFTLSAEGEFRSDDPNQDHNGEAMDLIALGVIRMPERAVKEGDAYEARFKGLRSEKGKKGLYAFTQKVKVDKIEEKEGKKLVTLSAELSGKLEGAEKDPQAEEAWAKAEGHQKTTIEVPSGRVISAEGSGKVVIYHRGTNDQGGKQELTMTFAVEGKVTPR
jgi:hypothetical protein